MHQIQAPIDVQFYQSDDVVGIGRRATVSLPGFTGVIFQLVLLDPDFRPRKKIESVRVVPMDVADYNVGDIPASEARVLDGIGGLLVIGGMPLAHELIAIKAAVE